MRIHTIRMLVLNIWIIGSPFFEADAEDYPRLYTNSNGKVIILMDSEPGPPVVVQKTQIQTPVEDMPPPPQVESIIVPPSAEGKPKVRMGQQARREAQFTAARERMVTEQLASRNISNNSVLEAMRKVPRNRFVPSEVVTETYEDKPLDIGYGRTMESPYVIASAAEQLDLKPTDRILEIGTGSGYQTAVLSWLVKEIYSVESDPMLARRAEVDLQGMGYTNNVFVRQGDVTQGWPEAAPFDAIVVNGEVEQLSKGVLSQLKEGGRIVFPATQDGKSHVLRKSGTQPVPQTTRSVRLAPAAPNKVELETLKKVKVAQPSQTGQQ